MPLPERRKSPEELAKLRESLGVPAAAPGGGRGGRGGAPGHDRSGHESPESEAGGNGPSSGAPRRGIEGSSGDGKPEIAGIRELSEKEAVDADPIMTGSGTPADTRPMTQEEKPREKPGVEVHSLRKSAGLVVDQPKPVRHREDGSLPVRRHTDEELRRMRRLDAGPPVSAAEALARQALSRPAMILLYLAAAAGLSLLLLESLWISRSAPLDLPFDGLRAAVAAEGYRAGAIAVVGGANALVLLAAGWVAWRRPLSRHHAGFVALIAGLVLIFGTLYFFPNLHAA